VTRLVAVLGLLCGCGRIGFSPLDDGRPDAALDPHTPFGPPVLLADLSSPMSDDDPTLTGDLLEIIWDSERTAAASSTAISSPRTSCSGATSTCPASR